MSTSDRQAKPPFRQPFRRFDRIVDWLLVVVLLGTMTWIGRWGLEGWAIRDRLVGGFAHFVERQVSEAIGLPVHIRSVRPIGWGAFLLRDVEIGSSMRPGAPRALVVSRVVADVPWWSLGKPGADPIRVRLEHPRVLVGRDARGELTFQPKLPPPPPSGPVQPPVLPDIRVTVRDATLLWTDAGKPPFARTRQALEHVQAHVRVGGTSTRFRWNGRLAGARVSGDGEVDWAGHPTRIDAHGEGLAIRPWVDYFAPSREFRIESGLARTDVRVSWNRPDARDWRLDGRADVQGGQVWVRAITPRIEAIRGRVRFDARQVTVEKAEARVCGNLVQAHGRVGGWDRGMPTLDFRGEAIRVKLPSLLPFAPSLATLDLQGEGRVQARVSGPADRLLIVAEGHVARGRVVREDVEELRTRVVVDRRAVRVEVQEARVADATVQGQLSVGLERTFPLTGRVQVRGASVVRALTPYVRLPIRLDGRVEGEVQLGGDATAPRVDVVARSGALVLQGRRIEDVRATTRFGRDGWQLREAIARDAGGTLRVSGGGRYAGPLRLDGMASNWSLDWAEAFTPRPIGLVGRVDGPVQLSVDPRVRGDFRVTGRARVPQAAIGGVELEAVQGRFVIDPAGVRVAGVTGRVGGGDVRGSFRMGLGSQARGQARWAATHIDLARMPLVQRQVRRSLGPLVGWVDGDGRVDLEGASWQVVGTVRGQRLEAGRWGRLECVEGVCVVRPDSVSLRDVAVSAGADVSGSIGGEVCWQGPRAGLDLRVAVPDASISSLIRQVYLDRILLATDSAIVPPGGGPVPDWVRLTPPPPREIDGVLPLARLLQHWQQVHLAPLRGRRVAWQGRAPWASLEGRAGLDVEIRGPLQAPVIRTDFSLRDGRWLAQQIQSLDLEARVEPTRIVLSRLAYREGGEGGAELSVRGVIGGEGVVEGFAQNLDLDLVNPYLAGQDLALAGKGSFTLVARGPWSDPYLQIGAEILNGALGPARDARAEGGFSFDQAEMKGVFREGTLFLTDKRRNRIVKEGKAARVHGSLPLVARAAARPYDLFVELQGDSLGVITPLTRGEILWKGGDGELKAHLGGTPEAPILTGSAELRGVAFRDRNLEQDFTDVKALVSLSEGAIKLERATAAIGNGSVNLAGRIRLVRFVPTELNLQGVVREARVGLVSGLFRGQVDANLQLGGTLSNPRLGGLVAVSQAVLDLDALPRSSGEVAQAAGSKAFPLDFRDLTVRLLQGVQVLGPKIPLAGLADARLMDVIVDGALGIGGRLAEPEVKGVIVTRSGTFTPVLYTFDIQPGGTIEFLPQAAALIADPEGARVGASRIPPTRLDLVARGQVMSYDALDFSDATAHPQGGLLDVIVTITGSLTDMKRRFECRNEPQLTQERIERVIGKETLLSGIIRGDVGGLGVVTQEVSGILSTATRRVLSPVAARVASVLPLETLELDLVSPEALALSSTTDWSQALAPTIRTETRSFGSFSIGGSYSFRRDRNVYQLGLRMKLSESLALQLGIDNRLLLPSGDERNLSLLGAWRRTF
jgi:hypothetical protein